MGWEDALGIAVTTALLVYLLYAMLNAEKV